MNVRLAMEDVPIHVTIQMEVITVNVILDIFYIRTNMTVLDVSRYMYNSVQRLLRMYPLVPNKLWYYC